MRMESQQSKVHVNVYACYIHLVICALCRMHYIHVRVCSVHYIEHMNVHVHIMYMYMYNSKLHFGFLECTEYDYVHVFGNHLMHLQHVCTRTHLHVLCTLFTYTCPCTKLLISV